MLAHPLWLPYHERDSVDDATLMGVRKIRPLEVEIACPGCRRKFRVKVKDMVPGRSRACPWCSVVVEFTGDDGRKVQRGLDDFEKALKRIGRKLR